LNKLEICVSIIALTRFNAIAIADYRSPSNATRSRNGNTA